MPGPHRRPQRAPAAPDDRPKAVEPRFLGLDEGPFTFDEGRVPIAGVLTRGAQTVEAVVMGSVEIDGWDATDVVANLAKRLPGAGPDVLLIGGVNLGGMNIVDIAALARRLARPVLGITRRAPGPHGFEAAILRLPDPDRRRALLPAGEPVRVAFGNGSVMCQGVDANGQALHGDAAEAAEAVLRPSRAGAGIPEPLRLAHHIATALVRGVSGTPA